MKLKPEVEPRLRTAGGGEMKMRASRMRPRSCVAWWAMAPAAWLLSGRSAQGLRRMKARAELWSPLRPETWLKLMTSGTALKYAFTSSSTPCRRASVAPAGRLMLARM